MRHLKYEITCQVCGEVRLASWPWEKACPEHRLEYRRMVNRATCKKRYEEYKTLKAKLVIDTTH
jgi:hypothetical protein